MARTTAAGRSLTATAMATEAEMEEPTEVRSATTETAARELLMVRTAVWVEDTVRTERVPALEASQEAKVDRTLTPAIATERAQVESAAAAAITPTARAPGNVLPLSPAAVGTLRMAVTGVSVAREEAVSVAGQGEVITEAAVVITEAAEAVREAETEKDVPANKLRFCAYNGFFFTLCVVLKRSKVV